jgi:hypothetical protein
MATIKSYSDLQQSKKLAEILPLESADMSWVSCDDGRQKYYQAENRKIILNYEKKHWLYCWSLAALLGVLPKIHGAKPILDLEENSIQYTGIDLYVVADNPVDACYEMILKLNELKML